MTRTLILCLVLAATVVADGRAGRQDVAATAPVALLSRVRGDVRVQSAAGSREARLFERLQAGDVLRTGDGSEAVIVFRTGARTRLAAGSEARIDAGRAVRVAGHVEALAPVPALPLVAPVAGAGTTITAVRIRAGEIRTIEPLPGATTLADSTRLVFDPAPTEAYEVVVEGPDGRVLFQTRVHDTQVTVPAGVLQPGVAYLWRVGARLATGFEARGEGRFRTLSAADARARGDLRAALAGADAESLALLAEVDWALGLWTEAAAGFRAARQAGATDPAIDARLSEMARRQAGEPPASRRDDHR